MMDKIGAYASIAGVQSQTGTKASATELADTFGSMLNQALNNLKGQEKEVEQLTEQFIKGELSDVHQLSISAEKMTIGLELTVQIRNKVIEAYQEIMRMQL